MGAVAPELNFSLSELEQAGLLSCVELQLVGLSGIPPAYALLGNAQQSNHSEAADPNTARGTARPKALLADPSSGVPLSQHASSDTLLVTETRQVQAQANAGSARRAVDSLDRKQAANRAHQARYRNRQKAQKEAVQCQLASTTAELQQLKLRQQQLEELLRQAHISSAQPKAPEAKGNTAVSTRDDASGVPFLSVSIQGKECQMTAQQVMEMPTQQFFALWDDYMREIKACMKSLQDNADPGRVHRMEQLTFEAVRLRGKSLKQIPSANKDSSYGALKQPCTEKDKLGPSFYALLLQVLKLSQEQIQDLELLRRLYLTRRRQLAEQRKNLMAAVQKEMQNPVDSVAKVAELGAQLQQNATEDHQIIHSMSRAVYCGVLTMRQTGEVIVYCHPDRLVVEDLLNAVAAENGLPAPEEVAADTSGCQGNAWPQYAKYVQLVDPDLGCHVGHVPFVGGPRDKAASPSDLILEY